MHVEALSRQNCLLPQTRLCVNTAVPSPPSVSVAAAGIDPSQDGQSGISEICTSSQALHAASCQNESAVYSED
jgi:hypothetical protein